MALTLSHQVIFLLNQALDHFVATPTKFIIYRWASLPGQVIYSVGLQHFRGLIRIVDDADDISQFFKLLSDQLSLYGNNQVVDVNVALDSPF